MICSAWAYWASSPLAGGSLEAAPSRMLVAIERRLVGDRIEIVGLRPAGAGRLTTRSTSSSVTSGPWMRVIRSPGIMCSMSPWPSSCSAPGSPRMVRLSILDETRKLIRLGRLALITPVSTSTEGRWVATIRWMPAARAFCDRRWIADSISLPAVSIRSATSSTTTTISGIRRHLDRLLLEHRHAGAGLEAGLHAARELLAALERVADPAVVGEDVAHAQVRHQPVALVHLAHHPLQRDHRLVRLGHHRREQMGDALVDRQLDHLGIDHDHLALVGRQPVEQRQDHRVDRDRLARAGGAGDQQVRHARQIDHDRLAADVLAEREGEARRGVLVGGARTADRADRRLALIVGQLDADHVAPRHGRDPHRHRAQRAGDVVGERDHPRGARAGRRLELVERDHRPGPDVDDLAAHAEIVQHLLERARGLGERRAIEADAGALRAAAARKLSGGSLNSLSGTSSRRLGARSWRSPTGAGARCRRRLAAAAAGSGLPAAAAGARRVLGRGDRRIDRAHQSRARPAGGRARARRREPSPPTEAAHEAEAGRRAAGAAAARARRRAIALIDRLRPARLARRRRLAAGGQRSGAARRRGPPARSRAS